jgi:hypothetical protein
MKNNAHVFKYVCDISGPPQLTISLCPVSLNAVGGGRITITRDNLAPTNWLSIAFVPDRNPLVGLFILLLGLWFPVVSSFGVDKHSPCLILRANSSLPSSESKSKPNKKPAETDCNLTS